MCVHILIVISFIPTPANPASFSSKQNSHLFPIQHPRVSASCNRGEKFKIKNQKLQHSRRPASAFTLIELLAVVGIMGLLAAVAVPALKGLTGSGGRKQALNQVMGALEIARNTALNTGTNAAVIFPDSSFGFGDAYKYRSMAVVSYNASNFATATTNTNTSIAYDKLVSSWIVLPQGISFLPNYLATNTTTNMIPVTALIQIPPKTNSTNITCPGIVFQSDGGLFETNSIPVQGVAFFEGTVTGTNTNPTSKMTSFETVRLTRYGGRTRPTLAPAP